MKTDLERINFQRLIAPYAHADTRDSLIQVLTSVIPYLVLWGLMMWSLRIFYWLTLAISVLCAGFLIRSFIVFHDCCHGSFFKKQKWNDALGAFLGILVFTPYDYWKHNHAIHHATAGNLDKRGIGDVTTWTVEEYLSASWWKRLGYRIMRNPFFLFTIGSSAMFLIIHRFYRKQTGKRERRSVIFTNLALLVLFLLLGLLFGFREVIMVQLPIIAIGTSIGVWMFYVQHQFEGVYWERAAHWSFVRAGLEGSSYYKLPALLQWFTGNIGFHHIHHLGPRIPNYRLPACFRDNPELQVKPLTILESFKCVRLNLWDEANKRMVGFEYLKDLQSQPA